MLRPLTSPSWLRYAHAYCRRQGCDFEDLMRVGEPLNDPAAFCRVFAGEETFAGRFWWGRKLGWLAVTYHEPVGTPPALHFWPAPGVGVWEILRVGRVAVPQLLDMHGGFVNACLPKPGIEALALRLGAKSAGGGNYRWATR